MVHGNEQHPRLVKAVSDVLCDEELHEHVRELEAVLSELEKAAWARSWLRLKAAREKVYELTMADLRDRLRKDLE